MKRITDIMTRNVDLVSPGTTLEDAASKMKSDDIGALPVGEGDRLVGMLTDRDIVVRAVAEGKDMRATSVRDTMSPEVLYCYDDQPVDEVLANMADTRVRRMPVVNREKRLVGMISIGDLSRHAAATKTGRALHAISAEH